MNKTNKTVLLSTVAVAAFTAQQTALTEVVFANEDTSTTNGTITQQDVDTAKSTMDEAAAVIPQAEQAVETANQELVQAETNATTLTNTVDTLTEATSTPKDELDKIATEKEKTVEQLTQDKSTAEQVVAEKTTPVEEATKEVETAKTDVDAKQAIVDEKQEKVDELSKSVTKEDVDNAQQDVTMAETAKTEAQQDVTTKEAELTTAKEVDAKRDADLTTATQAAETAKTDKETKEQDVTTKEADVVAKEEALEKATIPFVHDIALMPEWVEAYKEWQAVRTKGIAGHNNSVDEYREAYLAAVDKMAALDEDAKKYDEDRTLFSDFSNNDTSEEVDINNLTTDQKQELNELIVNYVNSLRKQLGITKEVKLNQKEVEFATKVVNAIVTDNYSEPKHYGKAINKIADEYNLKTSAPVGEDTGDQYYENLMTMFRLPSKWTKNMLFYNVMKSMNGFVFEGYQNYGHFKSLIELDTLGADTSFIAGGAQDGTFDVLKLHILGVEDNTVKNEAEYENTWGVTNAQTVEPKDPVKAKADLDKANEVLQQAKEALTQAENKVTETQAEVDRLTNTPLQTPEAEKALQEAKDKLTQAEKTLADAKQTLSDVTASKADRDAKLEVAQKELDEATKELETVTNVFNEKDTKLKEAQKELDEALAKFNDLKEKVELAEKEAKDARAKHNEYDANLDKLAEANKELITAVITVEVARDNKKQAESLLIDAQNIYKLAHANYLRLVAQLNAQQAIEEVLNHKETSDIIERTTNNGNTVTQLEKEKTILDTSVTREKVSELSQVSTKTRNENVKKLPKTGSDFSNMSSMGLLLLGGSLGLVGKRYKKKNS